MYSMHPSSPFRKTHSSRNLRVSGQAQQGFKVALEGGSRRDSEFEAKLLGELDIQMRTSALGICGERGAFDFIF